MRTALDTNVISALWSNQASAPSVRSELDRARIEGGLAICGLVYAELAAHPATASNLLDLFLADTNITIDFTLDESIWRESARAFSEYADRRRKSSGGQPKRFLADFAIGAHALLKADRLFTLDRDRYTQSFPQLKLFSDSVVNRVLLQPLSIIPL